MEQKQKPLKISQNFLKSEKTVRYLVSIANLKKTDVIFEIGAGKGIITRELSSNCGNVIAIEYDSKLYSHLLKNNAHENVMYINADILRYNFPGNKKYKVFANIPYTITTKIIEKLLFSVNPPEDTFLIIQKEAAERFAGSPYKHDTLKSLLLKPFFMFEILHELEPDDFHPPPGVNSVFLRIKKQCNILLNENEKIKYYDFIAYTFERSGNIMNRLASVFTRKQLLNLSSRLNFNICSGVHDLLYQQWILIFFYYLYNVSDEKKKIINNSYTKYKEGQMKINKIYKSR